MSINVFKKMPLWSTLLVAVAVVVAAFWLGNSRPVATGKKDAVADSANIPMDPAVPKASAQRRPEDASLIVKEPGNTPPGMVWIPGGVALMGNASGDHEDERVEHEVALDGFWMDATEVTNRDFRKFVQETGYVTLAEKTPTAADLPGVDFSQIDPANLAPGSICFT